jgi:DNA-binding transcriptional MerR regulator
MQVMDRENFPSQPTAGLGPGAGLPVASGVPDPGQGVYAISVAAQLCGIGVQSLRLYERHGLVTPSRSDGGTRRYSNDDLARVQRIVALSAAGINLAGIGRILDLEDANSALRHDNHVLRTALRRTEQPPDERS